MSEGHSAQAIHTGSDGGPNRPRRSPSVDPIDRPSRDRTQTGLALRQIAGGVSTSPPTLPSQPDDDDELISFGTTEDRFDPSEPTAAAPTHIHDGDDDIDIEDVVPSPHITPPPPYSSTTVPTSQTQQEAELAIPPSHGEALHPTPETPASHESGQTPHTDAEMSDAASAPRPPSSASSIDADVGDYIAGEETIAPVTEAQTIPILSTDYGFDYGMNACVQHLNVVKEYLATNRRIIRLCLTEPEPQSTDALAADDFWASALTAVDQITSLISYIAPGERRHIDACSREYEDLLLDAAVITRDASTTRQRLRFEAHTVKHQPGPASFRPDLHARRLDIDGQATARQRDADAADETERLMAQRGSTNAKGKAVDTGSRFTWGNAPPIDPSQRIDIQSRSRLFPGVQQPGPPATPSPDPTPVTAVRNWAEGLPPTTLHEPPKRLIDRLSTPFPTDTHHDEPMTEDDWNVVQRAPEPAAVAAPAPAPAIRTNKRKTRTSPRPRIPTPAPAPIVQPAPKPVATDFASDYQRFVKRTGIQNPLDALDSYTHLQSLHREATDGIPTTAVRPNLPPSTAPPSPRAGSRGSSAGPAHKKPKRAPMSVSKLLYISYTHARLIPNINVRKPAPLILDQIKAITAALLREQPSQAAPLASVTYRRAAWNRQGSTFTLTLDDVPNKDTAVAVKNVVATALNVANFELSIKRHEYISSVVFHNVAGITFTDHNQPQKLEPMQVLADAINRSTNGTWKKALRDGDITEARWAPFRAGSTNATLFVNINDTSLYAVTNALQGSRLSFDNGDSICMGVIDKTTMPQCGRCYRYGHSPGACRLPAQRCCLCGSHHEAYHHDNFVTMHGANAYPVRCVNCFLPHRSDSKDCIFYKRRALTTWINDAYAYMAHADPTQPPQDLTAVVPVRRETRTAAPGLRIDDPHYDPNAWHSAGFGPHGRKNTAKAPPPAAPPAPRAPPRAPTYAPHPATGPPSGPIAGPSNGPNTRTWQQAMTKEDSYSPIPPRPESRESPAQRGGHRRAPKPKKDPAQRGARYSPLE
ncbi:hypothetical protein LXA43DRAFT_1096387 [Ganoderma leucocontextum]|nr:hypothetical protein LXA43DRAFT_1096387 [Ganoderma leucocontextum]